MAQPPKQQWKAPVEDWVRNTYEKRCGAKSSRGQSKASTALPQSEE